MPDFSPFAGVRYDCDAAGADLDALAAPPYDVIDDEQHGAARGGRRAQLRAPDPAARRSRATATATSGPPRRSRAGATTGVLVADTAPRFYAYRMEFADPHGARRHTRGVIGALTLPEPGDDERAPARAHAAEGEVRPARAVARDARERRPDLGPQPRLRTHRTCSSAAVPLAACTDTDGVAPRARRDRRSRAPSPRSRRSSVDGPARARRRPPPLRDRVQLPQRAARRRRRRWRRRRDHDVRRRAGRRRAVHRADPPAARPAARRRRARAARRCVRRSRRRRGHPRQASTRSSPRCARARLGSSTVGLASTVPTRRGIGASPTSTGTVARPTPRSSRNDRVPRLPDATWQYRHDAHAVAALVDKGVAQRGDSVQPGVGRADPRRGATARVRMPQKTTFFSPKPRTGMVFRSARLTSGARSSRPR